MSIANHKFLTDRYRLTKSMQGLIENTQFIVLLLLPLFSTIRSCTVWVHAGLLFQSVCFDQTCIDFVRR